jgi:hypothetical protein
MFHTPAHKQTAPRNSKDITLNDYIQRKYPEELPKDLSSQPKKGSFEAVFGHLGLTPDEVGNLVMRLRDEVGRLNALVGPGGTGLGELERINDDLCYENERLRKTIGVSVLDYQDDDALRFVQRVLESDAPQADRQAARDMIVEIRTRLRRSAA